MDNHSNQQEPPAYSNNSPPSYSSVSPANRINNSNNNTNNNNSTDPESLPLFRNADQRRVRFSGPPVFEQEPGFLYTIQEAVKKMVYMIRYDFGEFCARIATWCTIAFMLGLVAYIFFHYLFYEGPYQSLLVINSEKYKSLSIKLGYGISGDIVISKTYRDGDRDSNSNSGNRKGETGGVIKKKNILIGASLNASTPELLEGLATSLVLNHVLSTAEATIFLQMSDAEIDKALQSGGETFVRVEIMFPRIWTTYKTIEIENSFKGNVQVDLGYFSQIHLENDFIIKARNGDVSITNVKVDRELRIDAPSGQLKAASTAVEGVVRARAGKDVDMRLNTSRNRALDIQVTSDTGLAHLDMPNQFYGHFSVATTSTSPPKLQSPESYTTLQISNGSRMEGFVSWDGAEPPPLPRVEVKGNTASLELR